MASRFIDTGEPSEYPQAPERDDQSTVAGAPGGYYSGSDEKGNELEPGVTAPPTLDRVGKATKAAPTGIQEPGTPTPSKTIHQHLRRHAVGRDKKVPKTAR